MKKGRTSSALALDDLPELQRALERLEGGFRSLPRFRRRADNLRTRRALLQAAERLRDNFPYFHPLYAGQMLKPPHSVARLAYALALWINPNNHALDGGRASSRMEKEAVAELARMVGWHKHLGHLCGSGTMANLEALWVASKLAPGKKIVASSQAHYTHERLSAVLGLPFGTVDSDRCGRMNPGALEKLLVRGGVGTVVATIGTTAVGSVDPLPELLRLQRRYQFRLHADAAYGGYHRLSSNLAAETRAAFARLSEVDSIVIDPHKHGLQPYGCGCVLFRDPAVGRFYRHDSPYTYFSSSELHLGEISLECSRPGASAVALWTTLKAFPLRRAGEFARGLEASREAALALYAKLKSDPRFLTAFPPELDIVVWIPQARRASLCSQLSRRVFAEAARRNLHLALAELPGEFFDLEKAGIQRDRESVTCLRSVLMKPEHAEWTDRIYELLSQSLTAAARRGKG